MNISGIYKIQSIIKPYRIYIGSAVNIDERWRLHLVGLRNNKHHSKKLQRHYKKYGESDLQFIILLGCKKEDLIKTEQYFLDSYNPYFNNCKIAGSTFGTHHKLSEETKAKMRISNKPPSRKGLPSSFKGKSHSEESKQKNRDSNKGRIPWNNGKKDVYSKSTIEKMRYSALHRNITSN